MATNQRKKSKPPTKRSLVKLAIGEKKLMANTNYTFDVAPPDGYRLAAGAVLTNLGAVNQFRIRNNQVSCRVDGPTLPICVYLDAVFERVA